MLRALAVSLAGKPRTLRPGHVLTALAAGAIGLATLPVALFGIGQLLHTIVAQFSAPAEITDFVAIFAGPRLLLIDPGHLYAPGAAAAVDQSLTGLERFDRPFSFLPHAALLLVPLALLPYGLAYAVWLLVGVVALVLSAWLLAPRWRYWPFLLMLFLPAQLDLIMGQTSALALLAFSLLVRLVDRRPVLAGVLLACSPVTWKPQLLLPAFSIALAAARRWRVVASLYGVLTLLIVAATLVAGLHWVADYRAQAAGMWALVSSGSSIEAAGQTLLGLVQAGIGPGDLSVAAAIAGGGAIYVAVAYVWWRGLRPDRRRLLQFALLPLAAVLAAPHALGYELTLWLASAWLLLRYAEQQPSMQRLVVGLCLSLWATGNVVVLTENDLGFPWAALQGLFMLGAITWLYAWESARSADTHPPARA
jgi:glycosyl transferase family 87